MKKIVVQLTFEDEDGKITQAIENGNILFVLSALAELDITPPASFKEYDDEYGEPVIYFP